MPPPVTVGRGGTEGTACATRRLRATKGGFLEKGRAVSTQPRSRQAPQRLPQTAAGKLSTELKLPVLGPSDPVSGGVPGGAGPHVERSVCSDGRSGRAPAWDTRGQGWGPAGGSHVAAEEGPAALNRTRRGSCVCVVGSGFRDTV